MRKYVWQVDYTEQVFEGTRKQSCMFATKKAALAYIKSEEECPSLPSFPHLHHDKPRKVEITVKKGDKYKDTLFGTTYEVKDIKESYGFMVVKAKDLEKQDRIVTISLDLVTRPQWYKKLN